MRWSPPCMAKYTITRGCAMGQVSKTKPSSAETAYRRQMATCRYARAKGSPCGEISWVGCTVDVQFTYKIKDFIDDPAKESSDKRLHLLSSRDSQQ
eukprot:m.3989 g.3989  ORF g.3989 m.3989 type:complete len:96 (+) comp10049_c0_seq2:1007-1294(+)